MLRFSMQSCCRCEIVSGSDVFSCGSVCFSKGAASFVYRKDSSAPHSEREIMRKGVAAKATSCSIPSIFTQRITDEIPASVFLMWRPLSGFYRTFSISIPLFYSLSKLFHSFSPFTPSRMLLPPSLCRSRPSAHASLDCFSNPIWHCEGLWRIRRERSRRHVHFEDTPRSRRHLSQSSEFPSSSLRRQRDQRDRVHVKGGRRGRGCGRRMQGHRQGGE